MALPQPERVVVAGREVADVEEDAGDADERMCRPRRDESFGDATLIEHLDRARVETAGARPIEILTGPSLDDHDIDTGQLQLGREHHPGRPTARDHHRMFGHVRYLRVHSQHDSVVCGKPPTPRYFGQ